MKEREKGEEEDRERIERVRAAKEAGLLNTHTFSISLTLTTLATQHIEHAISTNITDGVPHKLPAGASTFSVEQPPTNAATAGTAQVSE